MQKEWRLKAEMKCGTLGTEQVFVCKEGKGSFLIGKNSLTGDISLGFDNTAQRFFVEVIDKNEQGHRLWAGRNVVKDRWYTLTLTYPGKALRHFTDRFTADPAFTIVGNTVYAYVGEDATSHGPVLSAADFPYAQPGGSWAGQVVEANGKFYYYVTLDRKDNRQHTIDVAVSDLPTGPFKPARADGTPLITDDMKAR